MPDASDRALQALLASARGALAHSVTRYADGNQDSDAFGDRMLSVLTHAHTHAVVLGRHRAGDTTAVEEDDRRFAEQVMREEEEFLSSFLDDLESGQYNDEAGVPRRDLILKRAELYLGRVVGSANEAWALTTGGQIWWRLGEPETEHCPECPALAKGSPYTADTLPTYPRANETTCLSRCLCRLENAQGQQSFEVP